MKDTQSSKKGGKNRRWYLRRALLSLQNRAADSGRLVKGGKIFFRKNN